MNGRPATSSSPRGSTHAFCSMGTPPIGCCCASTAGGLAAGEPHRIEFVEAKYQTGDTTCLNGL
jgi:hypothetical protein